MQPNFKPKIYNDGVIDIYSEKENKSDFNAKINAETLADLDFIAKMNFSYMSIREQDSAYADSLGRKLDFKIKIPFYDAIKQEHIAVFDNMFYDIYSMDIDKVKHETYLYMEGVGPVAEED